MLDIWPVITLRCGHRVLQCCVRPTAVNFGQIAVANALSQTHRKIKNARIKAMTAPVVGIISCSVSVNDVSYNGVMTKYLHAIRDHAKCAPLIIPAAGGITPNILDRLDGILLTGSLSNVHPRHYAGDDSPFDFAFDEQRDETILPMIREAHARGKPLLAICRGLQELNVALGGSLRTNVGGDCDGIRHHPVAGYGH